MCIARANKSITSSTGTPFGGGPAAATPRPRAPPKVDKFDDEDDDEYIGRSITLNINSNFLGGSTFLDSVGPPSF
jgi:hypothetical protein